MSCLRRGLLLAPLLLAAAPVAAQSLDSARAWSFDGFTSSQFPSRFARSVALVGDVNGDGYDDVVTSEPLYFTPCCPSINQQGLALAFYGSPTGPSSWNWLEIGDNSGTTLGWVVAAAGDVDGDGYDDVVYSSGSGFGGGTHRIHVQFGSTDGLNHGWSYDSGLLLGSLGPSVAVAGDVNGDGYDDIVGGIRLFPSNAAEQGRVVAFHGGPHGLGSAADWEQVGERSGQELGWAVSSAGDVDDDGHDDVLVSDGDGVVRLYRGSGDGLADTWDWSYETPVNGYGITLARAGDVNGDRFDDFALGLWNLDHDDGEGVVRLFLGGPNGPSAAATPDQELRGDGQFGHALASAGDLNGDGYDDMIIGAPALQLDHGVGRAYLHLGSPSGLRSRSRWSTPSSTGDLALGWSVASGGDVDGDGYIEVVVGDPTRGRVHLFSGIADLLGGPAGGVGADSATQLRLAKLDGDRLELRWGESCSAAEEDFAVYAGDQDAFSSYDPLTCSTLGRTFLELEPDGGSRFYLVVPQSADREGSYGTSSAGEPRPTSVHACRPQEVQSCASGSER